MSRMNLRQWVLTAMFAAMVAVGTMVIQIPTPATRGFVNVGDAMIYAAAVFMGPVVGGLAGGIGSALADLLLGYAHWAPWTLVIKGVEGLLVGALAHADFQNRRRLSFITVGSMVLAGAWMVLGYYVSAGIMRGFAVSIVSVPGNIIQAGSSIAFALPVIHGFRKLDLAQGMVKETAKHP